MQQVSSLWELTCHMGSHSVTHDIQQRWHSRLYPSQSWYSKLLSIIYINKMKKQTNKTNTRWTALCSGLPGWAGNRKVKRIWILLKQEAVSGSGISWATCKSASRSRQITMPAPHCSSFLQAECPSCRPTNSVKALKAQDEKNDR